MLYLQDMFLSARFLLILSPYITLRWYHLVVFISNSYITQYKSLSSIPLYSGNGTVPCNDSQLPNGIPEQSNDNCTLCSISCVHNGIIARKHYFLFVRRVHRSPVSSPTKYQWSEAVVFHLLLTLRRFWIPSRVAGDLRILIANVKSM